MNARKLQVPTSAELLQRLVPHVAPADDGHDAQASPAAELQRRLDAALAATPWAGIPPPDTPRWPGGVRLTILVLGVVSSWAAVAGVVRALI